MKNFNEFLTEAHDKNVHLEHIEDEVLNLGINGTRQAINFLRSLRDMLAGNNPDNLRVTVKWDGAPAVFCGTDPESGKFFVGTKSIFNKEPKLNFTNSDIDRNHPSPGLNSKLKLALKELSKAGIKGILQGDMMFTQEDLKIKTIDGEKMVTFQPNTILYAIPKDSDLGKRILSSKMGIVFHTSYSGKSIKDLKASFNVNIGRMRNNKRVWIQDANYEDDSGTATMTKDETAAITAVLSKAGKLFRTMDSSIVNEFAADEELRALTKQFNNAQVREGQLISNPKKHARNFLKFLKDKSKKEIEKRKTDKGKQSQKDKLASLVSRFERAERQLVIMFEMMSLLREAKLMIVNKLKKIQRIGTFLQTSNGFKVTSPEGFVAVDHLTGNAVKLVDRLEFSRANFNAAKNWTN